METLDLERDDARELLARAEGSVKTAMVMHWTGVDREKASEELARSGGRLGDVIRADAGG